MRLTTPLSRLPSLALLAALLAGSGCSLHFGGWGGETDFLGQSVSTNGGVLTVDDVKLPFDRWVDVAADFSGTEKLELGTATDLIRLRGVAGTTAALKARLYSEIEGDGSAVVEAGRLVARSQGGGKVFINAIEGTVPAGIELHVQSGTGSIEISSLAGEARLFVGNGTGVMTLRDCRTGPITLEAGTGDMQLEQLAASSLDIETGTGAVRISGATLASLKIDAGTGDLTLGACKAGTLTLSTGTGSAALTGCEAATLKCESGTGDLLLDGGTFDQIGFSSGTGHLTQRNSVAIGRLKQN